MKLIQLTTKDGLTLPGLLYESRKKTKKVAILLHGNGSSSVFYDVTRMNTLAEHLNKNGVAFLPFNNRGAHYNKSINVKLNGEVKRVKYGTSYEIIKECVQDIDGALAFLRKQGYSEFYAIGESTGANKICVYNYYKPKNNFKKFVMVGAGDDTGIYYNIMGMKKFNQALKKAKQEIKKGNGRTMVPKYLVNYPFSYQALFDTINPDGDYNTFPYYVYLNNIKLSKKKLFREYKSIKKPTFVIFGSEDEYCYGRVEDVVKVLKKESSVASRSKFEIVKGADHGLNGYEQELGRMIGSWLAK